jgi:anti-sigma-K factor RskA
MASQDHIKDLIPGYALDCLDAEEKQIAEMHLAHCQECQAELATYQNVVDDLPLAVTEIEPPARLKGQILNRIEMPKRDQEATPGFIERFSRPIQRLLAGISRSPGFALASLALVVLLAAGNLALWNQAKHQNQAQIEGMKTIALQGTENSPGAHGLIVISGDGEYGTLVVDGLGELSPDQAYQLWLIRDGMRDNGGTFIVSHDGYGGLWVNSPQPLGNYQAFGVTIEPASGSPGPTGPKVLGGEF